MPDSRAISRILSIIIVIAIIAVAFAGYGFGYYNHPVTSTTTQTTNLPNSTVTVITIETVSGSSNRSLITMTEYVIAQATVTYSVTISGTCTLGQGVLSIVSLTTTAYISPTIITGNFSATITTKSSLMISTQYVTTTLATTSTTASTTGCPTIV